LGQKQAKLRKNGALQNIPGSVQNHDLFSFHLDFDALFVYIFECFSDRELAL